MSSHAAESLASVRVGGRSVPVIHRAQCHVCRSQHRLTIERLTVAGTPPGEIISRLPDDSTLTVRNVREHLRRGHLPLDHETIREVLEKGLPDPIRDFVIDATVAEGATEHIAQLIVNRVFDAVAVGDLEVTVRDGLRAAKYLSEAEQRRTSLREVRARAAERDNHRLACIARLIDIVGEITNDDVRTTLLSRASSDPDLGALMCDKRLQHLRRN